MTPRGTTSGQSTVVEHRLDAEGIDALLLTGANDTNMREVASLYDIRLVLRGDRLILSGELAAVEKAAPLAQHLIELCRLRTPFDRNDIARFAEGLATHGPHGTVFPETDVQVALPGSRKMIRPKSEGQRQYMKAIKDNDVVIGIGRPGPERRISRSRLRWTRSTRSGCGALSWHDRPLRRVKVLGSSPETCRRRSIPT